MNAWQPKRNIVKRLLRTLAGTTDDQRLVRPGGLAVEGSTVIICDPGAGIVHVLRGEDSTYVRIPHEGTLPSPIDAAVGPNGDIYVSDAMLAEVRHYSRHGELLNVLAGPYSRPTGIAFSRTTGKLCVADTGRHSLFFSELDGSDLLSLGSRGTGPGQFNFPTSVRFDRSGTLLVVDAMNFRIQRFAADSDRVESFGQQGDGSGDFARPKGIATDSDGNIYVVDALFDAVQIFSRSGDFLLSFGVSGNNAGEFWLPSGIAIDSKDRVYIADTYNARVQIFQYLKSSEGNQE